MILTMRGIVGYRDRGCTYNFLVPFERCS